ncbi:Calcium load-activated calcium channel [Blastocladiella emersonii ATCC 22665]|nr:Calcium load-activated calcium channel [Blastocladiella emersonii ATCC 22665]
MSTPAPSAAAESTLVPFFQVILFAAVVSAISEAAQWYLVRRQPKYQEIKKRSADVAAQFEVFKAKANPTKKGTSQQIKIYETKLSELQRGGSGFQMRGALASVLILVLAYTQLNTLFEGVVVAKLPFEPFQLIRGMTHKGLPDTSDPRECSATFIYILTNVVIRYAAGLVFPKTKVHGPSIWEQAVKLADKMQ